MKSLIVDQGKQNDRQGQFTLLVRSPGMCTCTCGIDNGTLEPGTDDTMEPYEARQEINSGSTIPQGWKY